MLCQQSCSRMKKSSWWRINMNYDLHPCCIMIKRCRWHRTSVAVLHVTHQISRRQQSKRKQLQTGSSWTHHPSYLCCSWKDWKESAEIFAFIESLTFADDKLQVHWLAHLAATFVRLHVGLVSVKDIMTQSNGTCCLSVCLPRFKICKGLVMVPVSARCAQRGCKSFCFALSLSLSCIILPGRSSPWAPASRPRTSN